MDVILLEDVKTLGKKGQIVKINDGYARNYVLPKKLGIEATAKNLNDLKLARKREEKEAAEELAAAKELAAKIKECTVTVIIKNLSQCMSFNTHLNSCILLHLLALATIIKNLLTILDYRLVSASSKSKIHCCLSHIIILRILCRTRSYPHT